jgi:hypothetical protein
MKEVVCCPGLLLSMRSPAEGLDLTVQLHVFTLMLHCMHTLQEHGGSCVLSELSHAHTPGAWGKLRAV